MSFSAQLLFAPIDVLSLSQKLDLLLIEMILGIQVLLLKNLNKSFGSLDLREVLIVLLGVHRVDKQRSLPCFVNSVLDLLLDLFFSLAHLLLLLPHGSLTLVRVVLHPVL